MFNVIFTKSLDHVDEIISKTWEYKDKNDAIALFNEQVKVLMNEAIENEYLKCKISMHRHKALIKLEDTHYVIAVVEDGGIFDQKN